MGPFTRSITITPQQGAGINWGHPLTRGLVEVIVTPVPGARSVVQQVAGTVPGTAPGGFATGPGGDAARFDQAQQRVEFPGAWSQRGAGLTFLADYIIDAVPGGNTMVAGTFMPASPGPASGFGFRTNATNYRFLTGISPGSANQIVGSAIVPGRRKVDVGVVSAGGSDFYYENGILAGSVARTGYDATSGAMPFYVGADAGGTVSSAMRFFCAMVWNRELTPNEIRQISQNPYQIFMSRNLYAVQAPSGSLALTATLLSTASITASLVQRVNLTASLQSVATGTAALTQPVALTGLFAGNSTITASLTVGSGLSATFASTASITANLRQPMALSSTLLGVATVSASLSQPVALSATMQGVSTVSANLRQPVALSGSFLSTASLIGTLTAGSGGGGGGGGTITVSYSRMVVDFAA